ETRSREKAEPAYRLRHWNSFLPWPSARARRGNMRVEGLVPALADAGARGERIADQMAQTAGAQGNRVLAGRHRPLRRELALAADGNHRLVGAPAIDVPELLEVRPVEVSELQPNIDERGFELLRLHRLADGGAQRRHDRRRRA